MPRESESRWLARFSDGARPRQKKGPGEQRNLSQKQSLEVSPGTNKQYCKNFYLKLRIIWNSTEHTFSQLHHLSFSNFFLSYLINISVYFAAQLMFLGRREALWGLVPANKRHQHFSRFCYWHLKTVLIKLEKYDQNRDWNNWENWTILLIYTVSGIPYYGRIRYIIQRYPVVLLRLLFFVRRNR